MINTNYFITIVKILEIPKQIILPNNINYLRLRVEWNPYQQTQIIHLVFWEFLIEDILKYYQINDYILIEGYLGFSVFSFLSSKNLKPRNLEVNILKIYPFLLNPYY